MQEHGPEQPGWTPIEDTKQAAAILILIAQAIASPIEVFLRTRFGSRYFGTATLGGLVAVPMWMLFWPGESATGITVFWFLYLLMQLRARIESARMLARGDIVHTRYNGWPRLSRFFKRMPEQRIKGSVEPLVVFVTGALMMPLSPPLGSYLMVAAVALGLIHSVSESVERAKVLELHDSFLEQERLSEQFRKMSNIHRH